MSDLLELLERAAVCSDALASEENKTPLAELVAASELKQAGYVTGAIAIGSQGIPMAYANLRITFAGREKLDAIMDARRARSWRGWIARFAAAILGWLAAILPDMMRDVLNHLLK